MNFKTSETTNQVIINQLKKEINDFKRGQTEFTTLSNQLSELENKYKGIQLEKTKIEQLTNEKCESLISQISNIKQEIAKLSGENEEKDEHIINLKLEIESTTEGNREKDHLIEKMTHDNSELVDTNNKLDNIIATLKSNINRYTADLNSCSIYNEKTEIQMSEIEEREREFLKENETIEAEYLATQNNLESEKSKSQFLIMEIKKKEETRASLQKELDSLIETLNKNNLFLSELERNLEKAVFENSNLSKIIAKETSNKNEKQDRLKGIDDMIKQKSEILERDNRTGFEYQQKINNLNEIITEKETEIENIKTKTRQIITANERLLDHLELINEADFNVKKILTNRNNNNELVQCCFN